jgi:hypothetical protein
MPSTLSSLLRAPTFARGSCTRAAWCVSSTWKLEDGRSDPRKVDNRPLAERQADHKDIAIHSWGGHVLVAADAGPGKVDGLLWTVAQTGRWGDIDHAAWAYAVEGGYQLPSLPAAPWLRVGYDRSSGDNDPTDDNHRGTGANYGYVELTYRY